MTSGSMLMGIIPAYAGSTITRLLFTLRFSDHPRIRGEHPVVLDAGVGDRGSSPHTRGARPLVSAALPPVRIIPAYAGSTGHDQDGGRRPQDHPRIRGEHRLVRAHADEVTGSSPHTRGALSLSFHECSGLRIIPAYAGSTWSRMRPARSSADHPRIRGEHQPTPCPKPPPTRIIPAYAGSTCPKSQAMESRTDHPRIRGEHRPGVPPVGPGRGSSPHTRGARCSGGVEEFARGIIPAYAGSTQGPAAPARRGSDHPRIRGEH